MALEIPGYENLTEIGRGGFAVVYRAWSSSFGREVAIKVLALPGSSEDDQRKFERERRIVGSLSWHPHIVTIYDSGETSSDQPFLVYEFLPGGSLGARLKALGPMSSAEAAAAGVQICDALEAAHRGGVLHRDVKPDNVMVDRFGELQLTDFGVAQMAVGTNTSTGTLVGTVSYMAPEIINGAASSVASDIYAAGSTLFTLLAGRAAFARNSDATPLASVMRAATEEVPDLRARGVDPGLASVIERAMAKEPQDRFPTAAAFAEALQVVQQSLGMAPTPVRYDRVVQEFLRPAEPTDSESTILRQPDGGLSGDSAETVNRLPPAAIVGVPEAGQIIDDDATRARRRDDSSSHAPPPGRRRRRLLIGVAAALLIGGAATGITLSMRGSSAAPPATSTITTTAPTSSTTAATTTTTTTIAPTTAPPTTPPPTAPPATAAPRPTTVHRTPTTRYYPPTTTYHPPATHAPTPPSSVCTVQGGILVCN